MDVAVVVQRLCHVKIWRLVVIMGVAITLGVVFQCFSLPYGRKRFLEPADEGLAIGIVSYTKVLNSSESTEFLVVSAVKRVVNASDSGNESRHENGYDVALPLDCSSRADSEECPKTRFQFERSVILDDNLTETPQSVASDSKPVEERVSKSNSSLSSAVVGDGIQVVAFAPQPLLSPEVSAKVVQSLDVKSSTSVSIFSCNSSAIGNTESAEGMQPEDANTGLLETFSVPLFDSSTAPGISILKRWDKQPTSISQMNSLLLRSIASSHSKKPQWSSVRDRELMSAKLEIKNSPAISNIPGLSDHVFRNVSTFKRSYELMERILKVYIYKEGENPIFHQPKMRGIYASEGWFMKLMEANKKYIVRDPRKAHLFYLPFSAQALRNTIDGQKIRGLKDLQGYLKNYVEIIAQKYRFWNKSEGADHFVVACHDWAPRLTSNMGNCIRALCNANAAKGFKIGKDTSLPVTYVRSVNESTRDLGGKPPSERPILAFFAGSMHGYLRPILLHYWENKESDMKINGPMPRDIEGKKIYREHMKNSKYCICARGYEVHTPRIVEAIFNECVPVIISDNYVPPFFEVFNWEAFAVFVSEKDIPNLRDILLAIPNDEYLQMHARVKMVQKHFLWHKNPVKYDLFHMVLHSIWLSRISQVRVR